MPSAFQNNDDNRAPLTARTFSDWFSLSEADRVQAQAICRARLALIGKHLNAVTADFPTVPRKAGPLAGLPYVAKDMFATGSRAPSWGCAEPLVAVEPRATVLARLDADGADLIAMAEMTALAYEPSGYNAARGRALNPWDVDLVAGGSSSGPAVLVASGCCFVGIGSDTGGSVRIPAHCCGITALKPSFGAIPVEGVMPLAPSLDTVGIMARSAADLTLVWPSISGRSGDVTQTVRRAVLLEDAFNVSDPDVVAACREAITAIERLQVAMTSHEGFPEDADRHALIVMQAEAARIHRGRIADTRIDPVLRKRIGKGLTISDAELASSLAERDALRQEFLRQLGDADVVLLPVMPIGTPDVVDVDPQSPAFEPRTLYAMSRFTRFVNYLGLPALVVPAGIDRHNRPVGLQIVGRPNGDAALLELGNRLQAVTRWHGRIPVAVQSFIASEKALAA